MKIAMNSPGISNTATLQYALMSVGLGYGDVSTVDLNFPDHISALANKSVDASIVIEPFASYAVAKGLAVRVKSDDEIDPGHQLANILYSERFAQRKDVATRFMRAYLRGARFYLKALGAGRLSGENAEEVIAILNEFTSVKDPAVLRAITPSGIDPNGTVNIKSLQKDLDFYRSQGLILGPVDLGKIVDPSFAREAAQSLGPFN
jgi:NitT/TauT family transport system substrate-binding protein